MPIMDSPVETEEDRQYYANLRVIQRADPGVMELLESAPYGTIYHYMMDTPGEDGEWVKQKLEGPIFVVRRNSEPKYAIYVLNRMGIRDALISLIPGEMKATVVADKMLQVARRGDRVRKAIWFPSSGLDAFNAVILRICGPPSARPGSTNPSAQPAVAPPAAAGPSTLPIASGSGSGSGPVPPAGGGDGISRLFAGIMITPSGNPTSPCIPSALASVAESSNTPPPAPTQFAPDFPRHLLDPTNVSRALPTDTLAADITLESLQASQAPAAPPGPSAPPLANPPPLNPFTPPPGQTVEDLLSSILGVNGFTPSNGLMPPPPRPAQQASQSPPVPANRPPIPPNRPQPHQAPQSSSDARNVPVTFPATSEEAHRERQYHDAAPPSFPQRLNELPGGSPSVAAIAPRAAAPAAPGPALNVADLLAGIMPQSHPVWSHNGPPEPPRPVDRSVERQHNHMVNRHTVVDSVVDALWELPDLRRHGRGGFGLIVTDMIHNEPMFLNDIWEAYQRRVGRFAAG
ncbi:uncharacterized protein MKK02DRAFT_45061 [Dioszegia hungarica]|uniref:Uncharacterized protein n=1 Tax=Dioszegia hungarica TaxID=4972 RepID=A0AA38HCA9_9TREE|nr:uncharacterized protein MKK02DRAFT_45061 [Dioszegia hungarica]KAI9636354.1 hypothetical protein MKK02DRAFT_45061 [Dioszegia hungarica]